MGSFRNSNIALRIVKFSILVLITFCFVHCNTSNHKIASSFLKRRYTKGHFFERPNKVHTEYITYVNSPGSNDLKPVPDDNKAVLINSNQTANNLLPATISLSKLLNYTGKIATSYSKVLKNPKPEVQAYQPEHPGIKINEHGFALAKPYLIGFLICVAVILFIILVITSGAATNSGYFNYSGCLLLLLGILVAITAIVFFILFLCALAPPAA
jgi:hypothetical protein